MTVPLWSLLAFAAWTLLTLAAGVGSYRWAGLLSGRDRFSDYAEYEIEGAGWYRRGMRAHANCVENLPIFGAVVLVATVAGVDTPGLDVLALVVIGARVPHTVVHVALEQTDAVTAVRGVLYITQFLAMAAMVVLVAVAAP